MYIQYISGIRVLSLFQRSHIKNSKKKIFIKWHTKIQKYQESIMVTHDPFLAACRLKGVFDMLKSRSIWKWHVEIWKNRFCNFGLSFGRSLKRRVFLFHPDTPTLVFTQCVSYRNGNIKKHLLEQLAAKSLSSLGISERKDVVLKL